MRPYSLFQAFASRGENVGYELLSFKQLYNMLDDRLTGVGLIRVFILTTRYFSHFSRNTCTKGFR